MVVLGCECLITVVVEEEGWFFPDVDAALIR